MTLQATRPRHPVATEAELLFKEAHQRRRRRRLLISAIAVVAIAIATAAVALSGNGHSSPPPAHAAVQRPAVKLPGTAPRVAWVDYQGRIHIGSLQTRQQRIVASGDTDPVSTLTVAGNKIFWPVRSEIPSSTIMAYDTATGQLRKFAGGAAVFKAIGSNDVFVDDGNDATLARYRPDGRMVKRFDLPSGWYLSYGNWGNSPVLAHGGILVQSQSALGQRSAVQPPKLAVWTPETGAVRPLAQGWIVVATHTDSRGTDSVFAWFPAACETSNNCPLNVTDLGTGRTRQIISPLGFGFDFGGGFSPDGRQLAVFAKSNSGNYNPETRMALVDVASGSLRLVPGATVEIGEAIGWAQWLPGTSQLIGGGECGPDGSGSSRPNCFRVDSQTLSAAPLRIAGDVNEDVNYSTAVLP